jgi:hypothetical protein
MLALGLESNLNEVKQAGNIARTRRGLEAESSLEAILDELRSNVSEKARGRDGGSLAEGNKVISRF